MNQNIPFSDVYYENKVFAWRIELTNIAHEIQMKYADVYICLKYLVISNN